MAIITPIVFTLVFAIVQAGVWFHARNVATSAAQVAVQQAAVRNGSAAAGQEAGHSYIAEVGGLQDVGVAVSRTATSSTATVTGDSPRVLPILPLPTITVTSTMATERITP